MVAQIINLSELNGINGFIINNSDDILATGWSVSRAGDINGDGIDDFLIGAPNINLEDITVFNPGSAYVVFGRLGGFGASIDLATLDGSNGFAINDDPADGGFLGFSVSGTGDVNRDGFDDLILGAPVSNNAAGKSFVIFGNRGGFNSRLNVNDLNGSNGFSIEGNFPLLSGWSVSSAGNVNGDLDRNGNPIDDFIIAAPNLNDGTGFIPGSAYVVFGRSDGFGASIDLTNLGSNGFVITGLSRPGDTAFSVSEAGDVNGDGIDDIIVGVPNGLDIVNFEGLIFGEPISQALPGKAYVIFGRSGGFAPSFNVTSLDGSNGFAIDSVNNSDTFGASVSKVGDLNDDGIDDVIIGAPTTNNNQGAVYVVFGHAGGWTPSLNASSLDGNNGFIINGINPNSGFGLSVGDAGDINDDGIDDAIIGAFNTDEGKGATYVIYGKTGGFPASLDINSLQEREGLIIQGIDLFDSSGFSASGAGDVNGDGADDVIIGAFDGNDGLGASYIVYGIPFSVDPIYAQYGASYPDLITNIGYNLAALRDHYLNFGTAEGRSLDLFDELRYIASNPNDLIPVFGTNGAAATEHYIRYGYKEGRSLTSFDALRYIASNPADLIPVFGTNGAVATEHYIQYGYGEGRPITTFDPSLYLASNPDLIFPLGKNRGQATIHYVQHGNGEGRPTSTFDPRQYLISQLDVLSAYGANLAAATDHFVDFGWGEGRIPDTFDEFRYLASNTDVLSFALVNGLDRREFGIDHYLDHGLGEGRSTTTFDPIAYGNANRDLAAAGVITNEQLSQHYVFNGYSEGRPVA